MLITALNRDPGEPRPGRNGACGFEPQNPQQPFSLDLEIKHVFFASKAKTEPPQQSKSLAENPPVTDSNSTVLVFNKSRRGADLSMIYQLLWHIEYCGVSVIIAY